MRTRWSPWSCCRWHCHHSWLWCPRHRWQHRWHHSRQGSGHHDHRRCSCSLGRRRCSCDEWGWSSGSRGSSGVRCILLRGLRLLCRVSSAIVQSFGRFRATEGCWKSSNRPIRICNSDREKLIARWKLISLHTSWASNMHHLGTIWNRHHTRSCQLQGGHARDDGTLHGLGIGCLVLCPIGQSIGLRVTGVDVGRLGRCAHRCLGSCNNICRGCRCVLLLGIADPCHQDSRRISGASQRASAHHRGLYFSGSPTKSGCSMRLYTLDDEESLDLLWGAFCFQHRPQAFFCVAYPRH